MNVFTISLFDTDTGEPIIGPKLSENSTPEEFSEKMRQLMNAYVIFKSIYNHEDLPLFPQYEKDIIESPLAAAIYSYCFLKSPWKKAEKSISSCKEASLLYALKVLKGRFLAGEKSIAKSTSHLLTYCIIVFKRKRLPDFLHNKMIAYGIKDPKDKFVKRYFAFKGVKL